MNVNKLNTIYDDKFVFLYYLIESKEDPIFQSAQHFFSIEKSEMAFSCR